MKQKLVVPIEGLHCKACEILTEDNLKKLDHVEEVNVNHKTGWAEITYSDSAPDMSDIAKSVAAAGYKLANTDDSNIKKEEKKDFSYWFSVTAAILIAYWLLTKASFLEFGPTQGDFSAPMALTIGLVAGVSTCLALVGGLVLSISANYAKAHPNASRISKFKPQLYFNAGRVLGFFVLGGLLGALGAAFKLSTFANSLMTMMIGLIILVLGLKLLEISPVFNKFDFSLPKRFGKIARINNPLILGALTFFIPCGFTQAMQAYALGTGTFFEGGLVMALFAIGTAPGMLGIGGASALANKKTAKNFFLVAGILVVAFALFNLINGYRLFKVSTSGLAGQISTETATAKNNSTIEVENGIRIIRMVEHNRGYSPNYFVILKDQPVKWIIDAQAPYSCASALVVPALKIQSQLKPGDNIFEFTPTQLGEIKFSCSMGMYSGKFLVTEDESLLR